MRIPDVDLRIAQLSAAQYGMFTVPQAIRFGINLKSLQARFHYGLLERFDDLVIRHPATPVDAHAFARAAWVGAGDDRLSSERTRPLDAVVTSFAAARALGLDIPDDGPIELLVAAPTHSLPADIPIRVDTIIDDDWAAGPGFPIARPARAIVDILAHSDSLMAAAGALRESEGRRDLDTGRLVELLHPLARQYGHATGHDLLHSLQDTAVSIDWRRAA